MMADYSHCVCLFTLPCLDFAMKEGKKPLCLLGLILAEGVRTDLNIS